MNNREGNNSRGNQQIRPQSASLSSARSLGCQKSPMKEAYTFSVSLEVSPHDQEGEKVESGKSGDRSAFSSYTLAVKVKGPEMWLVA